MKRASTTTFSCAFLFLTVFWLNVIIADETTSLEDETSAVYPFADRSGQDIQRGEFLDSKQTPFNSITRT
jgi:hypothetical protein